MPQDQERQVQARHSASQVGQSAESQSPTGEAASRGQQFGRTEKSSECHFSTFRLFVNSSSFQNHFNTGRLND